MSRSDTLNAVGILAGVRSFVDALDAVDELAHRFTVDPLGVHGQAGEWELDGEVSLSRFGLGLVVERDTPDAPGWSDATVIKLHLGPIAVSAVRYRPSRRRTPVVVDCALGGPLGEAVRPRSFDALPAVLTDEELRAAGFLS